VPGFDQGQHRQTEDPAVVALAPVLLKPAVEGPQARVQQACVAPHVVLDGNAKRGQHDLGLDTLAARYASHE
jgi:hypothetical protein